MSKKLTPLTPNLRSTSAWLPSVLAATMALSACDDNDSMPPSTPDTDITATDTTAAHDNATDAAVTDHSASDALSAEEKMIDMLTRYRWTLTTATDANAQPINELMAIKKQVTLSFSHYQAQNRVSYSVGCNTMSAGYQLAAQTLTTENSMSTQMSCGELDIAENHLNKRMQGSSEIVLSDQLPPTLTQVTSDAATLVWTGKMTAQAKYNSKGETIFWAIDAESKPCAHDSAQHCLQVTPLTYDDQGIKINEGEKMEFAGTIDGYQPDSKHDNVLRLQRYPLENSAVTGVEYAYVLDMVIESKMVE